MITMIPTKKSYQFSIKMMNNILGVFALINAIIFYSSYVVLYDIRVNAKVGEMIKEPMINMVLCMWSFMFMCACIYMIKKEKD